MASASMKASSRSRARTRTRKSVASAPCSATAPPSPTAPLAWSRARRRQSSSSAATSSARPKVPFNTRLRDLRRPVTAATLPRVPARTQGGSKFFQLQELSTQSRLISVEESRRERKKRLTRQRIVMAAVELFETHGYEQTTVAQIAAAADVDPKTFFNYFGSKDEVLFSDIDRDYDVLLAAIGQRRPDEGPGEALARAVREFRAHRRSKVPAKEPEELSATLRLAFDTPAVQAK